MGKKHASQYANFGSLRFKPMSKNRLENIVETEAQLISI